MIAAFVLISAIIASDAQGDQSYNPGNTPEHLLFFRIQYYDIQEGEFFSILNPTTSDISICNWSVTDNEGKILFKRAILVPANSEMSIARNAASYQRQNGCPPDYCLLENEVGIPVLQVQGSFRLNNDGDELVLMNAAGEIIDVVLFGLAANRDRTDDHWNGEPVPSSGRGRILRRQTSSDSALDTNTKTDWLSLREYRPGQSSLSSLIAEGKVTALLLPEHSNIVLERLNRARDSILICSHELDSIQICKTITDALSRGVEVKILLEGSPAGGLSEQSRELLVRLRSSGASIYLMVQDDSSGTLRRYSCIHSKYIVIDDDTSIISSENLINDIFDNYLPIGGNRGWGAIVESTEVASFLARLFQADIDPRFGDIRSAIDLHGSVDSFASIEKLEVDEPIRVIPPPPISIECDLELHIFPDSSSIKTVVSEFVGQSEHSFFAEIFYADLIWNTRSFGKIVSPIVESMRAIIDRCEEFVFCIDNSWISTRDGKNEEFINQIMEMVGGKDGYALVGYPNTEAPFDIVHNKGMVVDHRLSWVSSVNWNYASISSNREVSLVIDSQTIADFFERNILIDHLGDSSPPDLKITVSHIEEGGLAIGVSGDSDQTGLKSVIIRSPRGQEYEWKMKLKEDRNQLIEIEAVDLWDNCATYELLVFPDRHSIPGTAMINGSGLFMTMISGICIFGLVIPVMRMQLLRFYNYMRRI